MPLISDSIEHSDGRAYRVRRFTGGFTVTEPAEVAEFTPPADRSGPIDMSRVGAAAIERMVDGKSETERAYMEAAWDRQWRDA